MMIPAQIESFLSDSSGRRGNAVVTATPDGAGDFASVLGLPVASIPPPLPKAPAEPDASDPDQAASEDTAARTPLTLSRDEPRMHGPARHEGGSAPVAAPRQTPDVSAVQDRPAMGDRHIRPWQVSAAESATGRLGVATGPVEAAAASSDHRTDGRMVDRQDRDQLPGQARTLADATVEQAKITGTARLSPVLPASAQANPLAEGPVARGSDLAPQPVNSRAGDAGLQTARSGTGAAPTGHAPRGPAAAIAGAEAAMADAEAPRAQADAPMAEAPKAQADAPSKEVSLAPERMAADRLGTSRPIMPVVGSMPFPRELTALAADPTEAASRNTASPRVSQPIDGSEAVLRQMPVTVDDSVDDSVDLVRGSPGRPDRALQRIDWHYGGEGKAPMVAESRQPVDGLTQPFDGTAPRTDARAVSRRPVDGLIQPLNGTAPRADARAESRQPVDGLTRPFNGTAPGTDARAESREPVDGLTQPLNGTAPRADARADTGPRLPASGGTTTPVASVSGVVARAMAVSSSPGPADPTNPRSAALPALIEPLFGSQETTLSAAPMEPGRTAAGDPATIRHAGTTAHPSPGAQIAQAHSLSTGNQTEIRLAPEELGRVKLQMQTDDGAISVTILAERPETADLIRRNLDQLVQEFRNLGYRDVSFHFGGNRSGTGPGTDTQPARSTGSQSAEAPAAPPTSPPAGRQTVSGHLDLRL